MNVNKAILVGRLTRDPEVRSTQTGQTVTNIGLATTSTWTDKNGQKQEKPEFHNLVLWGRLAEIAGQYLMKGQECYFEGRLQTRSFTGKDGVERRTTEIVVENMQMGSKPMNAQGQGGGYRGNSGGGHAQGGAAQTAGAGAAAGSAGASQQQPPQPSKQQPAEEEIPTINLDDEKDDVKIEDVPF